MTDEVVDSSAGDLEILNAEEKPEEIPVEEKEEELEEEELEEEEKEEKEEELEEEEKEEEEEPEEEETSEEEKEDSPRAIRFGEIKKEFPELFKKYPELRANYFKAEQYGEIFPTVDSAKEASSKAEVFDQFSNQASNGDIWEILATVGNNNPNALSSISEKILPQLYNLNPQLYVKALNPEIRRVLQTAWKSAKNSKNEDLQNSVAHLAQFLGLDKSQPQTQVGSDPEKEELRSQLVQNYNRDAYNFNDSVYSLAYNEVSKLIKTGINPKNFNEWQTSKLNDDIITEVNEILKKDIKYQKETQYLFNQATRSGLSEDSRASIISAYLARAKMIIPQIRQKILSKAQGQSSEIRKKVNVGQGSAPGKTSSRVPSRKEIQEKGMSDLDIINY